MARKKRAGIFDARATFVRRFQEVARLAGDVARAGHAEKMRDRHVDPARKSEAHQQRSNKAGYGAFPGLLGAETRRHGMTPHGAADKVGGRVPYPDDDQREE